MGFLSVSVQFLASSIIGSLSVSVQFLASSTPRMKVLARV